MIFSGTGRVGPVAAPSRLWRVVGQGRTVRGKCIAPGKPVASPWRRFRDESPGCVYERLKTDCEKELPLAAPKRVPESDLRQAAGVPPRRAARGRPCAIPGQMPLPGAAAAFATAAPGRGRKPISAAGHRNPAVGHFGLATGRASRPPLFGPRQGTGCGRPPHGLVACAILPGSFFFSPQQPPTS